MSSPPTSKPKPNFYPPWAPRFWNGLGVRDYSRLMIENRFQVHPSKWAMAFLVGGCSIINSTLAAGQSFLYSQKIAEIELTQPPVFVIGHWRSGTTLMHELIGLDPQFAFPTNFDAFVPRHLLVSRYFLYPLVKLLLPSRRPMDNMKLDASYPQEDDFALCSMGAPTPYRRIAFPNRDNPHYNYLNLSDESPEKQEALRRSLSLFFKILTIRYNQRLVLKSPPHTGRVKQLMKWFPGAKFIHMTRNPYDLVPSTMRLWRLLDSIQGFQLPKYSDNQLRSYIHQCKDSMYQSYLSVRSSIPKDQLFEIQFESLVNSPVDQMERLYTQLELGNSEAVKDRITAYFESRKSHQKNRLAIDETLKIEIDDRWAEYQQNFGY